MNNKAKSLHILKKKNYVVRVDKVDGFKYKVSYPPFNIFEEKSEGFSREYSFGYDGGVTVDGEFLDLPPYLRRLAILMDVYSQCHYLKIDNSLICYFDEEGKESKDFFELTGNLLEADKDGLTKEQIVYKMLVDQGEGVSEEDQKANFRSWKLMKGLSL